MGIIKGAAFDTDATAHEFYRKWFNLIDLIDKKWYSVSDHHGIHSWRTKMLLSTMRHFMVNAWALVAHKKYVKWIDF